LARNADAQRQRILRAAVRLFSQRGYHATSLKQLARQAGMTAPNLYHYYRSKEEILFEVYNSQLTPLLEELEHLRRSEHDPAERIRAFAFGMVYQDLEEPMAGFVPSNRLLGLRGVRAKTIREKMREIRDHWVTTIQEGVDAGLFDVREPKLVALNALTMCSYVATWFDPKGAFSKADVAKEAAESVLRMLGYRSARG
jgi:AcrR family transcriptional regulator